MQDLKIALLLIFAALALWAAWKDIATYVIPNWISLALAALFALEALVSGAPAAAIGLCVATGMGVLLIGMGLFAAGWIGGGDAKLLAAVALWIGWPAVWPFLLNTALAGGALTLTLLALRSVWLQPVVAGGPTWLRKLSQPGGVVPYGLAIVVGALATLPQSAFASALPR